MSAPLQFRTGLPTRATLSALTTKFNSANGTSYSCAFYSSAYPSIRFLGDPSNEHLTAFITALEEAGCRVANFTTHNPEKMQEGAIVLRSLRAP